MPDMRNQLYWSMPARLRRSSNCRNPHGQPEQATAASTITPGYVNNSGVAVPAIYSGIASASPPRATVSASYLRIPLCAADYYGIPASASYPIIATSAHSHRRKLSAIEDGEDTDEPKRDPATSYCDIHDRVECWLCMRKELNTNTHVVPEAKRVRRESDDSNPARVHSGGSDDSNISLLPETEAEDHERGHITESDFSSPASASTSDQPPEDVVIEVEIEVVAEKPLRTAKTILFINPFAAPSAPSPARIPFVNPFATPSASASSPASTIPLISPFTAPSGQEAEDDDELEASQNDGVIKPPSKSDEELIAKNAKEDSKFEVVIEGANAVDEEPTVEDVERGETGMDIDAPQVEESPAADFLEQPLAMDVDSIKRSPFHFYPDEADDDEDVREEDEMDVNDEDASEIDPDETGTLDADSDDRLFEEASPPEDLEVNPEVEDIHEQPAGSAASVKPVFNPFATPLAKQPEAGTGPATVANPFAKPLVNPFAAQPTIQTEATTGSATANSFANPFAVPTPAKQPVAGTGPQTVVNPFANPLAAPPVKQAGNETVPEQPATADGDFDGESFTDGSPDQEHDFNAKEDASDVVSSGEVIEAEEDVDEETTLKGALRAMESFEGTTETEAAESASESIDDLFEEASPSADSPSDEDQPPETIPVVEQDTEADEVRIEVIEDEKATASGVKLNEIVEQVVEQVVHDIQHLQPSPNIIIRQQATARDPDLAPAEAEGAFLDDSPSRKSTKSAKSDTSAVIIWPDGEGGYKCVKFDHRGRYPSISSKSSFSSYHSSAAGGSGGSGDTDNNRINKNNDTAKLDENPDSPVHKISADSNANDAAAAASLADVAKLDLTDAMELDGPAIIRTSDGTPAAVINVDNLSEALTEVAKLDLEHSSSSGKDSEPSPIVFRFNAKTPDEASAVFAEIAELDVDRSLALAHGKGVAVAVVKVPKSVLVDSLQNILEEGDEATAAAKSMQSNDNETPSAAAETRTRDFADAIDAEIPQAIFSEAPMETNSPQEHTVAPEAPMDIDNPMAANTATPQTPSQRDSMLEPPMPFLYSSPSTEQHSPLLPDYSPNSKSWMASLEKFKEGLKPLKRRFSSAEEGSPSVPSPPPPSLANSPAAKKARTSSTSMVSSYVADISEETYAVSQNSSPNIPFLRREESSSDLSPIPTPTLMLKKKPRTSQSSLKSQSRASYDGDKSSITDSLFGESPAPLSSNSSSGSSNSSKRRRSSSVSFASPDSCTIPEKKRNKSSSSSPSAAGSGKSPESAKSDKSDENSFWNTKIAPLLGNMVEEIDENMPSSSSSSSSFDPGEVWTPGAAVVVSSLTEDQLRAKFCTKSPPRGSPTTTTQQQARFSSPPPPVAEPEEGQIIPVPPAPIRKMLTKAQREERRRRLLEGQIDELLYGDHDHNHDHDHDSESHDENKQRPRARERRRRGPACGRCGVPDLAVTPPSEETSDEDDEVAEDQYEAAELQELMADY
ncbi:hypothetical protein B0H63DRAFT_445434 [Podospora didyma]|uniref:Uncharacterized protein n=1 Tax=Podospora didyma TaxID=330526 RepID=A0AAE0NWX0_9PEZI|nr:hypothetical protein B0H63DRAFT_445434 [Podospora didyma]